MFGKGDGHGGVDEGGAVWFRECYGGEAALGWEGEGEGGRGGVEVGGWESESESESEWNGRDVEEEGCFVRRGKGGTVRIAFGGYIVCFCQSYTPGLTALKPSIM